MPPSPRTPPSWLTPWPGPRKTCVGRSGHGSTTASDHAPVFADLNPAAADAPTFTEGSSAVNLLTVPATPAHFISDADGPLISKATVTITGGYLAGVDVLNATSSGGNIVVSYVNGVLLLSGTDTIDNYEAVLRTASYGSLSDDPSNGGASTTRTRGTACR